MGKASTPRPRLCMLAELLSGTTSCPAWEVDGAVFEGEWARALELSRRNVGIFQDAIRLST